MSIRSNETKLLSSISLAQSIASSGRQALSRFESSPPITAIIDFICSLVSGGFPKLSRHELHILIRSDWLRSPRANAPFLSYTSSSNWAESFAGVLRNGSIQVSSDLLLFASSLAKPVRSRIRKRTLCCIGSVVGPWSKFKRSCNDDNASPNAAALSGAAI